MEFYLVDGWRNEGASGSLQISDFKGDSVRALWLSESQADTNKKNKALKKW